MLLLSETEIHLMGRSMLDMCRARDQRNVVSVCIAAFETRVPHANCDVRLRTRNLLLWLLVNVNYSLSG